PAILIETVSAGGGSIAAVDEGGALRVGPRSAGAEPGPACYGRGGAEPTVTDACLALGWLDPAYPLADAVQLDRAAAERAVARLQLPRDVCEVSAGIVQVATAVMARALKRVSVARGIDPRGMALLPFGGAGPLFGCALADALGMSRVIVPPHPGVLSALGLAAAPERVDVLASLHRPLADLGTPHGCDARRQAGPRRRVAAGRNARRPSAQRPRGSRWARCDGLHRAGLARHRACIGRRDRGAGVRLDAVGLEVMAHAFAG